MSRDDSGNALNRVHRRKYLFSGLLKCGICGAGYTITGKDRYGCAAHRSKGICSNSRSVKRHDIEDRILSGLKDRLMAPELVASFTKEFTAEINRQTSDSEKERKNEERELATVTRKINAILEAIEDGMYTSSMKERMLALEDHKTKLQGALHTPPPSPLRIHPNIHKIYEQKVGELANTLNDDTVKAEASEIIRGLVDKVVLTPSKDDDQLHAQLHGDLATILELCDTDNTNKKRPSSIELGRQVSVVAGARSQ